MPVVYVALVPVCIPVGLCCRRPSLLPVVVACNCLKVTLIAVILVRGGRIPRCYVETGTCVLPWCELRRICTFTLRCKPIRMRAGDVAYGRKNCRYVTLAR